MVASSSAILSEERIFCGCLRWSNARRWASFRYCRIDPAVTMSMSSAMPSPLVDAVPYTSHMSPCMKSRS